MKQTNLKTLTLGICTAAFLAMSLIACENKKNNNNEQVNQVGYQNCTNCAGIVYGQEFLRTASQGSNGYVQLQMDLIYNGAMNTSQMGYYPPFAYYQGPVAATGTLTIASNTNFGYCAIPAGGYSVTTIQAGNWTYSGIMNNLRMLVVGPSSMIVAVTQGQIASPQLRDAGGNLSMTQRLYANVMIESVNNVACSMTPVLVQ